MKWNFAEARVKPEYKDPYWEIDFREKDLVKERYWIDSEENELAWSLGVAFTDEGDAKSSAQKVLKIIQIINQN